MANTVHVTAVQIEIDLIVPDTGGSQEYDMISTDGRAIVRASNGEFTAPASDGNAEIRACDGDFIMFASDGNAVIRHGG